MVMGVGASVLPIASTPRAEGERCSTCRWVADLHCPTFPSPIEVRRTIRDSLQRGDASASASARVWVHRNTVDEWQLPRLRPGFDCVAAKRGEAKMAGGALP